MTLYLPNVGLQSTRFGLRFNTQTFQSPLSGDIQRVELPGARWFAEYTFRKTQDVDMAELQAFLIQLRGRSQPFYAWDTDRRRPRGTGAGTPLVNGTDQTGRSLATDGWDASQTVLKAGDYIEVNEELKMVTQDAISDGSGECTVNFEPALRAAPADNAVITLVDPKCKMILLSDEMAAWEHGNANYYENLTISAVEVFN